MENEDEKAIWVGRTIAGGLLIVAASVCFGAGIIGAAILQNGTGFIGYLAAFVLGVFGLALLLVGLVPDASRPALTRGVWIMLRVCALAVLAFFAFSTIVYFIRAGI